MLDLYFKLHTIIRFTLYRPSRCTFCLGQRAAGKDLRVGENRTEGSPGESFFKVCQQPQARPGSLRHSLASLCVAGDSSFLRNHPQNSCRDDQLSLTVHVPCSLSGAQRVKALCIQIVPHQASFLSRVLENYAVSVTTAHARKLCRYESRD